MTQALKTQRRRFNFSLRTLFVVVLLAAVPLGFFARNLQLAARQRQAIEALEKSGFVCNYSYGVDKRGQEVYEPQTPAWLISFFGKDFFYNAESIEGTRVKNVEELARIVDLPRLHSFSLQYTPADAITPHLSNLDHLKSLTLSYCELTDRSIEHLRGLVDLETLSLDGNHITGAGLNHLCDSRTLRSLSVHTTDFDDVGMSRLSQCTKLDASLLPPKAARLKKGTNVRVRIFPRTNVVALA